MAGDVKQIGDGRHDRSSPLPETVELTAESLLEAALAWQRQDWVQGKRLPAVERLRANPALAANGTLAAELIYDEFVLRENAGDAPRWEDYLKEFPQYAEQLRALRLAEMIVGDTLGPPTENGTQFGDYELLEQIGQGGMGVVYKALQRSLGRTVAVKMLRSSGFAPQGELDRLLKEMSAASRLNHPNIIHVYNVGETQEHPFIAFEFVDGLSLAERISGVPLPNRTAATIVAAVAGAIQYANERGLIHRDLKPANVLLSGPPDQAIPKVTDFGASKEVREPDAQQLSQIIGTPSYMAPEQIDTKAGLVSKCTDVYGLGAILYECLTGIPPFRGSSAAEILRQVAEEAPVAPKLLNPAAARDLETICLKCLQKTPGDRYASAKNVADELNRFLTGQPIKARRPGPIRIATLWCRRNRAAAALSAALISAVTVGIAGVGYQFRQAQAGRQAAEAARVDAVANREAAHQLLLEATKATLLIGIQGDIREDPKIAALANATSRCQSILEKEPDDTALRITLTDVYGQLGTLSFYDGQVRKMSDWYQKARNLWEPNRAPAPLAFECRHCIARIDAWQA